MSGDTCTVLQDELHGGAKYVYGYADRNGDGIFNWVPLYGISSDGVSLVVDGVYVTVNEGVISLTNTKATLYDSYNSNK